MQTFRKERIIAGSVEKIAFFDASGLYALNRQQEALNCIIFLFSVVYDVDRPFYFRPVSKVRPLHNFP